MSQSQSETESLDSLPALPSVTLDGFPVQAISSMQQTLQRDLQFLLQGHVQQRRHIFGLQDNRMGLLEEVLPYCSFHTLTPRGQFGPALEDFAASTDRLWGEGARSGS